MVSANMQTSQRSQTVAASGTIQRSITDPAGAVVPGATITITNTGTEALICFNASGTLAAAVIWKPLSSSSSANPKRTISSSSTSRTLAVAITTPPGALSQSISVKFTKEEFKDLLFRAEPPLRKSERRLTLASPEGEVSERDDDADVVCHVEAGAGNLAAEPVRAQDMLLATRESVDGEKDCHEEPKEGDHLVGRKAGLADELDGGIGEHPEGEAREREANCLKIGDMFRSF
jgi:hypothetical protein